MEAVKLEGGKEIVDIVRRLTEVGIPVMAHVGLLPQRHTSLSGYKVQGRTMEGGKKILQDALALQEAGAFAMVVEAVPLELGKFITDRLKIPTIGIGAGPHTSGQVCRYSYTGLLRDSQCVVFTGSRVRRYYGCMVRTPGEIR